MPQDVPLTEGLDPRVAGELLCAMRGLGLGHDPESPRELLAHRKLAAKADGAVKDHEHRFFARGESDAASGARCYQTLDLADLLVAFEKFKDSDARHVAMQKSLDLCMSDELSLGKDLECPIVLLNEVVRLDACASTRATARDSCKQGYYGGHGAVHGV